MHKGGKEYRRLVAAFERIFGATIFFRTDALRGTAKVVQRSRFSFFREAQIWYSRDPQQYPACARAISGEYRRIRNPLNGIRLAMQMLQKRAGRQPIRTEDLDLVIGEVDRLNVLLTDLLTFHRKSTLKPLPQPILRVIQRCVQFMKPQAEESGIESQCERGDLAGSAGWIVAGSAADAITNELK